MEAMDGVWMIAMIICVSVNGDVRESPNRRDVRLVNSQVRRHVRSNFSAG